MRRQIASFLLWMGGWKLIGKPEPQMQKCIFIEAPHTSMWDFVWGCLGLWKLKVKPNFLIKKELFVFPIGGLLRALGGIPVNRGKSSNMVEQVVDMFNQRERFSLVITPEGTRKLTHHWKKGFYHIATKANVPIYLAYLNYEKKEGGAGRIFYPTGDYEKDIMEIEEFYKDKVAKFPENFNLSKENQK